MSNANFKHELGLQAEDKITGFSGIIVGRAQYLFGCNQYGLAPRIDKDGKVGDTHWFDEGRIVITGSGVKPRDVQGSLPGPDFNPDSPRPSRR